jgi:integrase
MARLNWSQINLRDGLLHVPSGKGDKEGFIGLMPRATEFFAEWKERCAHDLGAVPTTHPVLPTLRPPGVQLGWDPDKSTLWWDRPAKVWVGQKTPPTTPYRHCSESVIQARVHEAGRRIGIPELAPHDLRRSCAGLLEHAGVSLQVISGHLRHSNLNTTQVYLDSRPEKRAAAMAAVAIGF